MNEILQRKSEEEDQKGGESEGSVHTVIYLKQETEEMTRSKSKEFVKQLSERIDRSFGEMRNISQITSQGGNKQEHPIDRIEYVDKFVSLAEVGMVNAVEQMEKMLGADPKRFIYERDNAEHLLNKHNSRGQNAAYMAAKNGHKSILEFLYRNKANFRIPSSINQKYKEEPVEVATRWQHHDCVLWMINTLQLETPLYNSIYLMTQSKQIKQKISNKVGFGVKLRVLLCRCL